MGVSSRDFMSVVHFHCKECGQQIVMGRRYWGKRAKCTNCGTEMIVPTANDTLVQPPFLGLGWIGVAIICGVILVLCGTLTWAIFLQDNWEEHHRDDVLELFGQASQLYDSGERQHAVALYRQALTEIGSHKIKNAQLTEAVNQAHERITIFDAAEADKTRLVGPNATESLAKPGANVVSDANIEGDKFYDPSRTKPYKTSDISAFNSRRDAIQALAVQFGEDSAWVETNMGSSNDLADIHKNLVQAKTRESDAAVPITPRVGQVNYAVVDRCKTVWQSGGWRNKSVAEQMGAMNSIMQQVEANCPNASDREATLDYVQSHIDSW
jgi:hypothetical protein